MRQRGIWGWRVKAAVLVMAVGVATAAAEDGGKVLSAAVSVDYAGKYVWRGQPVNPESVMQTNVSGSAYGFTGSIWSNNDLTDDRRGEFSEVDYALDYTRSLGEKVAVSAGVIHYLFPNTGFSPTTEIYGGLSFDVPLAPSIKWYRDVNEVDGSYIQIGAGHSFEGVAEWANGCSMGVSLGASVGIGGAGYNSGYFGIGETRMNDFTMRIGVPLDLKHVTLTPSFNFSTMVDDGIGDGMTDRSNAWFGIGISKSF
jgi:hypothetical protein